MNVDFRQMLNSFLGDSAEVAVPNQFIDGTLLQAEATQLTLQSTPIYGPPVQIIVPYTNIDYVRILITT